MKILIIQEGGRHEENKHFRECLCMQRSLQKLGRQTDIWGFGHDNFSETPEWDTYDLILNFENYDRTGWSPDLSQTQGPKKFLWSIDQPFLETYHNGAYDLILQSTEDFVEENSVWFPNCYDHTLIKPSAPKNTFLGFCGSMLNRQPLLDYLSSEHDLKQDIWKLGSEMVQAVSSYKIHFNINLANDINYRSFETIGCETLLLTNHNPQYEKLGFVHGENCLIYTDQQSLSQNIEACKFDSDMITTISRNGYRLSEQHTYDQRAKKLLSIYQEC